MLTVSPVPIAATFEDRHVLTASTLTKAALRVAADAVERQFDHVVYFPAYEIATSPAAGDHYFEDDLRHLSELGVEHVMRAFSSYFEPPGGDTTMTTAVPAQAQRVLADQDVVCDEDLLVEGLQQQALQQSTAGPQAQQRPFDESRYLRYNPDVAAAVRQGQFNSGAEHYTLHGQREGRLY